MLGSALTHSHIVQAMGGPGDDEDPRTRSRARTKMFNVIWAGLWLARRERDDAILHRSFFLMFAAFNTGAFIQTTGE